MAMHPVCTNHNLLTHIFRFAPAFNYSYVSRAFRQANEKSLELVRKTLLIVPTETSELAIKEEQLAYQGVNLALTEHRLNIRAITTYRHLGTNCEWRLEKIKLLTSSITRIPLGNAEALSRLVQKATRLDLDSEEMWRVLAEISTALVPLAIRTYFLETSAASDSVSRHFFKVHAAQKEFAAHHPAFPQMGASYHPTRFFELENIAISLRIETDESLKCVWRAILPDPFMQHWDAAQIRAWMHDQNHQHHLTYIRIAHITGLTMLPHEIEKLNLRALTCIGSPSGQLRAIPQMILHLPELLTLGLYNNEIEEIPEWLIQHPTLEYLEVCNPSLRIVPDSVYRHFEGRIKFQDRFDSRLKEVPFRYWFMHRVCGINVFPEEYRSVSFGQSVLNLLWSIPRGLYVFFVSTLERIITFFRDLFGMSRMVRL